MIFDDQKEEEEEDECFENEIGIATASESIWNSQNNHLP